jgi:hypothetical protein
MEAQTLISPSRKLVAGRHYAPLSVAVNAARIRWFA